jgi:hypothetical protein
MTAEDPPRWAVELAARLEGIEARTRPPRKPARAASAAQVEPGGRSFVRTQADLARLAVSDPREYARVMSDPTFDVDELIPGDGRPIRTRR